MSAISALKARRRALRAREDGFTLIELLVVVIIIGILAAIAIPIYVNVQNNAKDAAVKSDLQNAKTAVVASYAATGSSALPALDSSLATYGYSLTAGVYASTAGQPAYKSSTAASTAFCIQATSVTTNQFSVTASGSVKTGLCA